MQDRSTQLGLAELRAARAESRSLYWAVGLFSLFANLLMLTGPMYMLQVYDRVLGSRSEETLIALSILVLFLYGVMGILDYTRGRIMARVGARFQARLDRRVFDAVVRKSAVAPDLRTQSGLADLESIQRFMTSPLLLAFFDFALDANFHHRDFPLPSSSWGAGPGRWAFVDSHRFGEPVLVETAAN